MSQVAPPPSIRERFVARARSLSDDPAFSEAIDHARLEWKRDQPDLPLEILSDIKDYPQRSFGMDPFGDGVDRSYLYVPPTWAGDPFKLTSGRYPWEEMVLRLCSVWWPPEAYPNWLERQYIHPSQLFVSACLIAPIATISEGLILDLPLEPFFVYGTPSSGFMEFVGPLAFIQARAALEERFPDMDFKPYFDQAWSDAKAAYFENDERASRPRYLLQLYPGMPATDLENAAKFIASKVDDLPDYHRWPGHERRQETIHYYKTQGFTNEQIALQLGISVSTVKRELRDIRDGKVQNPWKMNRIKTDLS